MNPWGFCSVQIGEQGKEINVQDKNVYKELYLHFQESKFRNLNRKRLSKVSLRTNRTLHQRKQPQLAIEQTPKIQPNLLDKQNVPSVPIKMQQKSNQTYLPQKLQTQKLIPQKLRSFYLRLPPPVVPIRTQRPSNIKINYINPQQTFEETSKNKTQQPPVMTPTLKHLKTLKRLNTMPQKVQQIPSQKKQSNKSMKEQVRSTKSMREAELITSNNQKRTQTLQDIEWKSVQSEIDDQEIRDEFSVLASRMDGDPDFTHELWANSWDLLAKSSSQTTSH